MAAIDRPHIVLESWGPIRPDDPWALRLPVTNGEPGVLQKGLHLVNDGNAVACGVVVEDFAIEPSVYAQSRAVNRIPANGHGFALVWVAGF
jgi:hypothetical protein